MSGPLTIGKLARNPAADSESLESTALVVSAGVFVVAGSIALLVFRGGDVPIAGEGSIGQFIALGAGLTALLVFVFARVLVRTRASQSPDDVRLRWYDIGALAIAHGVIALLGWIGIADVMSRSFVDAVVFPIPAALLAGVTIAVTAYVAFLSAVHLTPILVSLILALFLVTGIVTSMMNASDPLWWEKNLSSLGITDDLSARAFNITLIVAGVLLTTLAHYAAASMPVGSDKERRGARIVTALLIAIGLLLAGVGLFPLDVFPTAHNVSAVGMVVVFVALLIGLRSWLPSAPRVFLILGYVFIAVIVALAVFFATGFYNLTAVELIAAVLVFSWVIVFLRNTGAVRSADA